MASEEPELDDISDIIEKYGMTDGAHHKQWVLDQVMRIIYKNAYEQWVEHYEGTGKWWDEGVPP